MASSKRRIRFGELSSEGRHVGKSALANLPSESSEASLDFWPICLMAN
jgi:hypothetical protein